MPHKGRGKSRQRSYRRDRVAGPSVVQGGTGDRHHDTGYGHATGFEYSAPPKITRGRDLARKRRLREPWEPGWGEPAYMPSPTSGGRWRFYILALALAILALGAALTAIHFFLPEISLFEDRAVVMGTVKEGTAREQSFLVADLGDTSTFMSSASSPRPRTTPRLIFSISKNT
ncbi:MAG: hypothetical protein GXP49_05120 [Deltaproteobacteria bacterium]|nr:hypothetical protein [Deltaproteobacteria bacterium]